MITRPVLVTALFFLLTIAVDQATKMNAALVTLNTGISFGLFPSSLLTFLLSGVLLLIAYQFGKLFFQVSPVLTGIFFGGSTSNLIDRALYGGVRDFLPIPFFSIHNNLADWAIILSLLWLFWQLHHSNFKKEGIMSQESA